MNEQQFTEFKWLMYLVVFGQLCMWFTIIAVATAIRARDLDRIYEAIGRQHGNISTITIERSATFEDKIDSFLRSKKP